MEIFVLVLLYLLSQNPDFAESVKPLMSQLKNSEHVLSFLDDLSKFAAGFSKQNQEQPQPPTPEKENPQSPTKGIADAFIQNILDEYLKKQTPTQ